MVSEKTHQFMRSQMSLYDRLPIEVRRMIQEEPLGISVSEMFPIYQKCRAGGYSPRYSARLIRGLIEGEVERRRMVFERRMARGRRDVSEVLRPD